MMRNVLGRVGAVSLTTLREVLRERVLVSLAFYAILMGLAALLAEDVSIRQQGKIIKDLGLAGIEILGVLTAIFLGTTLVGRELERHSAHVVLAKPLTRTEFLFGKFFGLAAALFSYVAAMTAVMYIALALAGESLAPELLVAVVAGFFGIMLVAAIAVSSAAVMSPTLATILTFCVTVAGRYSDVIRNAHETSPDAPRWLLTTLYMLLPGLQSFDLKNRIVYGDPVAMIDVATVAAYGSAYSVVVLSLAAFVLRKRDLA